MQNAFGQHIVSYGIIDRALDQKTGQTVALQGLQELVLILPELEETLQCVQRGLYLAGEHLTGEVHQCVVNQRVEGTVLAGEIAVEAFAGVIMLLQAFS